MALRKSVLITILFLSGVLSMAQCPTGNVSGDVTITSSCSINTTLEIDGNLYLNGDLTLSGGVELTVTGSIIVNYVGSTTTYTISGGTIHTDSLASNNNSIIALSSTSVNVTRGFSGGYHGGLTLSNSVLNIGANYTEGYNGATGPVSLDNSTITTVGSFYASDNSLYTLTNGSSIEVGGNYSTGNSVTFNVTDSDLDVSGNVSTNQNSTYNLVNSSFSSGGSFTTQNGVTLDLDNSDINVKSGNLTNGYQASISASNGSSISLSNGDLVMSDQSVLDVEDSDIIVEGSLDNNYLADININSGGTLFVTDDVDNTGSIDVNGGTFSYGGSYSGTPASSSSVDTDCSDGCCGDCTAFGTTLERTKSRIYGAWETNSSWVDGSAPSTTGINHDVSIFGYIYTAGAVSTTSSGEKTMTIFDTLVVYGNLTFNSNSDVLEIKPGGVLVVFGDLSLKNQITIASGGILAVSGNFSKSGSSSQGSYSGDGVVYAGSFDSGDDTWVDGGGGSDQSKTITELSDDGYSELETFITGGGTTPLPITLYSFTITQSQGSVHLRWVTSSEKNNDYFTISKSRDGVEFIEIAQIPGSGDSNEMIEYDYTDLNAGIATMYYQLSQTDFDGTSEIIDVKRIGKSNGNLRLAIYPNPVLNNFLKVENVTSDMEWAIVDLFGVTVQSGDFLNSNEIQLSNEMPCGTYLMKVSGPDMTSMIRLIKN